MNLPLLDSDLVILGKVLSASDDESFYPILDQIRAMLLGYV